MYTNNWPPHIEGYVVNFLKKNYWRVQHSEEYNDAMQTAYVVFLRCRRRYPKAEDKHFMALFKTAWSREFADLSTADTKLRACVSDAQPKDGEREDFVREVIGDLENDGVLATMLRQAPQEVLMVLNLMLSTPQELLDLAARSWKKRKHREAFSSEHVAELLDLPPGTPVMENTRAYFSGEEGKAAV